MRMYVARCSARYYSLLLTERSEFGWLAGWLSDLASYTQPGANTTILLPKVVNPRLAKQAQSTEVAEAVVVVLLCTSSPALLAFATAAIDCVVRSSVFIQKFGLA